VAEDAESALELVGAGLVPALLVSDVAMPGMDGVALAQALRQTLPELSVLLVSGYANAVVEAQLAKDGIRYLAKPYSPSELVAAVAQQIRRG
jgi:two-component system cell cycle sensor histidine kinase/response regulator CckA